MDEYNELLNEDLVIQLEKEIREEFHIPPYFGNLKNLIKQSNAWFSSLVENINYNEDLVARGLLKNRVFYDYNNRVNEFAVDYAQDILTWQFSKIDGVGEEDG